VGRGWYWTMLGLFVRSVIHSIRIQMKVYEGLDGTVLVP
jgi:hypothetical protein